MIQRLLILFLFLILGDRANAQDWFPQGAKWHYNQVLFFPSGNTYSTLEVIGEVEINGKECRIIYGSGACSEFDEAENYLYEENDQVFIYDLENDQFVLLYDFNLQPGDTMSYHLPVTGDTYYRLDSISHLILGADTLRVQHFTWLEGSAEMGPKVYERIGNNKFLYPVVGFCDPGVGGLRCYEDDVLGLQKFSNPDKPCDYTFTVSTSDLKENAIRIYPIPTYDEITLEANNLIKTVEWIDIHTGAVLRNDLINANSVSLESFNIHPGLYLLKVNMTDGSKILKKVLISH